MFHGFTPDAARENRYPYGVFCVINQTHAQETGSNRVTIPRTVKGIVVGYSDNLQGSTMILTLDTAQIRHVQTCYPIIPTRDDVRLVMR